MGCINGLHNSRFTPLPGKVWSCRYRGRKRVDTSPSLLVGGEVGKRARSVRDLSLPFYFPFCPSSAVGLDWVQQNCHSILVSLATSCIAQYCVYTSVPRLRAWRVASVWQQQ